MMFTRWVSTFTGQLLQVLSTDSGDAESCKAGTLKWAQHLSSAYSALPTTGYAYTYLTSSKKSNAYCKMYYMANLLLQGYKFLPELVCLNIDSNDFIYVSMCDLVMCVGLHSAPSSWLDLLACLHCQWCKCNRCILNKAIDVICRKGNYVSV